MRSVDCWTSTGGARRTRLAAVGIAGLLAGSTLWGVAGKCALAQIDTGATTAQKIAQVSTWKPSALAGSIPNFLEGFASETRERLHLTDAEFAKVDALLGIYVDKMRQIDSALMTRTKEEFDPVTERLRSEIINVEELREKYKDSDEFKKEYLRREALYRQAIVESGIWGKEREAGARAMVDFATCTLETTDSIVASLADSRWTEDQVRSRVLGVAYLRTRAPLGGVNFGRPPDLAQMLEQESRACPAMGDLLQTSTSSDLALQLRHEMDEWWGGLGAQARERLRAAQGALARVRDSSPDGTGPDDAQGLRGLAREGRQERSTLVALITACSQRCGDIILAVCGGDEAAAWKARVHRACLPGGLGAPWSIVDVKREIERSALPSDVRGHLSDLLQQLSTELPALHDAVFSAATAVYVNEGQYGPYNDAGQARAAHLARATESVRTRYGVVAEQIVNSLPKDEVAIRRLVEPSLIRVREANEVAP